MPKAHSLSDASRQALSEFASLKELLPPASHSYQRLEDVQQRFRLWSGVIGAAHPVHVQNSLAHRVRAAPKLQARFEELLGDTIDDLEELAELMRGTSGVWDEAAVSEFDDIIESISESVRSLFKTSGIARKATVRDRYALALKKVPAFEVVGEEVDFELIGDLFPRLRLTRHDWLRNRLAKANNIRRRYFQYCEGHQSAVEAGTRRGQQKSLPSSATDEAGSERSLAVTVRTVATTVNAAAYDVATAESDGAESVVSAYSYATDSSTPMRYRVIDLEEVNRGEENFICPYCRQEQSITSQERWNRHVLSDLKAYVCIDRDCTTELFDNSRAWMRHQLLTHWIERKCPYCGDDQSYATVDGLKMHLRQQHSTKFHQEQLDQICNLSEHEPAEVSAAACPFCDWQTKLEYQKHAAGTPVSLQRYRRHIGSHLEQAALAVLHVAEANDSEHDGHDCHDDLHWSSDRDSLPSLHMDGNDKGDEIGSQGELPSRTGRKIPELDRINFEERRARIQRAISESLKDTESENLAESARNESRSTSPTSSAAAGNASRNASREPPATSEMELASGTLTIIYDQSHAQRGHGRHAALSTPAGPFPCLLAVYGCQSSFRSKIEWKRHVATQHMRLGFWRCDLCRRGNKTYNFNRKDLYFQHVRRMHAEELGSFDNRSHGDTSSEDAVVLHEAASRCYVKLRTPPPNSRCLFCDDEFHGSGSWEQRIEHISGHLEAAKKERRGVGNPSNWKSDEAAHNWLVAEGLVVARGQTWVLADTTGVAVSTAEIGQFTHTKGHLNDRPVTRGVREPELGYQLLDNLLYDACDSGDAQRVRQLLDGPRDASEALTARGLERALQHASSQGHEDIVQILLDDGVNVDCRNGLSPLRLASTGGHDRVVQLLLDRGASMKARIGDAPGSNALSDASAGGHETTVKLLLERGAKDYDPALHYASWWGQHSIVQLLLNRGANIDSKDRLGESALFKAAETGHARMVQMLIDSGADVNAMNTDGPALHAASRNGHQTIVQLLLDAGADINATDDRGYTALQDASANGHQGILQLLLDVLQDPPGPSPRSPQSLTRLLSPGFGIESVSSPRHYQGPTRDHPEQGVSDMVRVEHDDDADHDGRGSNASVVPSFDHESGPTGAYSGAWSTPYQPRARDAFVSNHDGQGSNEDPKYTTDHENAPMGAPSELQSPSYHIRVQEVNHSGHDGLGFREGSVPASNRESSPDVDYWRKPGFDGGEARSADRESRLVNAPPELQAHQYTRTSPGYHCLFPNCSHITTRKADLERHVSRTHPRVLFNCEWELCERKGRYGFSTKDKMVDHMRQVHGADIPKRRGPRR
ncbi:unnamed protein product [Zymoseptoria tritici ST99CH_1A5]|uniref:C2H2-type domain-containing protein n=1 Tax=Zymoseptoria tritici ST99CH_1A5 TaxID=1276529 RepID=A0A1Y6LR56_ZYMTR|nr:unnamed protein product [Zymoseptoria tritici ST99CH_1A5]